MSNFCCIDLFLSFFSIIINKYINNNNYYQFHVTPYNFDSYVCTFKFYHLFLLKKLITSPEVFKSYPLLSIIISTEISYIL